MILKLAVSDLLYRPKAWVGPLVFAFTCGLMCQFACCVSATEAQFNRGSFWMSGFLILFFVVIPSLPIAAALSNLMVERRSDLYARWQLVGARPRVVRRTVLIQLGLIGALGAAIGAIVSVMLYVPVFPRVLPELLEFWRISPADVTTSFPDFLAVCGCTALVFVVGGHGAVRRASSTSPVVALSALECPAQKVPILRIFLAICCFSCAGLCFWFMCGEDRGLLINSTSLFPIPVVSCFSALAPWLLPPLLRLWSASLKSFALPNLASKEACHTLASSFTIELAVVVSFGMLCGISSAVNSLSSWFVAHGHPKATVNQFAQFILFVCPAIVGLVGAATCALSSADAHAKNAASLILVGATQKEVVTMSIIESLMHIINALVMGALAVIISSFFTSIALGLPICNGLDLGAGAGVAIAGTVFIALVLCTSSLRGARRAIADANAVAQGEV